LLSGAAFGPPFLFGGSSALARRMAQESKALKNSARVGFTATLTVVALSFLKIKS
jgi:hypothetical protein